MNRKMGESWYEDWGQVVEMACVLAPKNSQHQYHEAPAWVELFFDLSFFWRGPLRCFWPCWRTRFPSSAYELDLGMFKEADARFRRCIQH